MIKFIAMIYLLHLAYIDPGAGSLLFQALLSGLLTLVVFYKRVILFLKSIFKRK
jgi:hypothetical protein